MPDRAAAAAEPMQAPTWVVSTTPPAVVFLHGLARSHRSLAPLRRRVDTAGFSTWARSYPSRRLPLRELATTIAGWIHDEVGDRPLVGVTHSLGGILVRHMRELLDWRGVVMLAPPNNGSRVAALMGRRPFLRWFYGPAGEQLASSESWPAPPDPFAVVAGTRDLALTNPTSWLTRGIGVFPRSEPNDGTVTVAETQLPGMADFATVDACHTRIANHPRTHQLVLDFLCNGRF